MLLGQNSRRSLYRAWHQTPSKMSDPVFIVQCRKDLLVRPDPDEFARLQVESGGRSPLAHRYASLLSGIRKAAPQRLEPIVKPSKDGPQTDPGLDQIIAGRINDASEHSARSDVSGRAILQVLADIPPRKKC